MVFVVCIMLGRFFINSDQPMNFLRLIIFTLTKFNAVRLTQTFKYMTGQNFSLTFVPSFPVEMVALLVALGICKNNFAVLPHCKNLASLITVL